MNHFDFDKACEKCELGMRKVAIAMARASGFLAAARAEPNQENKAELFNALREVNGAFIAFLAELGVEFAGEGNQGSLGEFVGELKKAFDEIQNSPF